MRGGKEGLAGREKIRKRGAIATFFFFSPFHSPQKMSERLVSKPELPPTKGGEGGAKRKAGAEFKKNQLLRPRFERPERTPFI